MMQKTQSSNSLLLLYTFLLISSMVAPIQGLEPRKLDETITVPGSTDTKCAPCNPSPPPPSPSPPPPSPPLCPPPPAPVLPPPAPKKPTPSGPNCPPPPSSIVYLVGPPGDLYPIDNDFSGARRISMELPVLIVCGLLGFLLRF